MFSSTYKTVLERSDSPRVEVHDCSEFSAPIKRVCILDDVALAPNLKVDAIPAQSADVQLTYTTCLRSRLTTMSLGQRRDLLIYPLSIRSRTIDLWRRVGAGPVPVHFSTRAASCFIGRRVYSHDCSSQAAKHFTLGGGKLVAEADWLR